MHYILEGKNVIPCDVMTWAKWFESAKRHIGDDIINDDIRVSTVFLGLDNSFSDGNRLPLLFETMVFGGELNGESARCTFYEDAEKMHLSMVERVKVGKLVIT